jgi:hypothetical protein
MSKILIFTDKLGVAVIAVLLAALPLATIGFLAPAL